MQAVRLVVLLTLCVGALGQISGPFTDTTTQPPESAFIVMDQPTTVAFWTAFRNPDDTAPKTDEGGAVQNSGLRYNIPEDGLYWIQFNILSGTCTHGYTCSALQSVTQVSLRVNGAHIYGDMMKLSLISNGTYHGYGSNTVILPLRKDDVLYPWTYFSHGAIPYATSHHTYVLSTINGIKIADI